MATNSASTPKLNLTTDKTPAETIVHCTGRIVWDAAELLRTTVKPLFSESKTVVLDLADVTYMDSCGLGTLVGLYTSAKAANCQLRLINLNQRLKELFSIMRLGELMAQGRASDYL